MRAIHSVRKIDAYLVAVLAAAVTLLLSSAFKHWLGAPNYGLGIVVGVTVVCYLHGVGPALLTFVLSMIGVAYLLMEPPGSLHLSSWDDRVRLIALAITLSITSMLVVLLRKAEHRLRVQKELIEEQNSRLQTQNEEQQAQNEEIQAQSEEIQAQNEELQTTTKELREVQEHLVQALQHETHIAQTLQNAFLPTLPSKVENLLMAATYQAGSNEAEIGGDFYDLFQLSDRRLAIAIGDASGKGLHAARQAVAAKYGLRAFAVEDHSPAKCMSRLNDFLCKDPDFKGFITLFYAVIDLDKSTLTYCSAGHLPTLIYRHSTDETIELNSTGRLIGVIPDGVFEEEVVPLCAGDRIIMYTDGITEARGQDKGFFGHDALSGLLAKELDCSDACGSLERIMQIVREHAGGDLTDDAAAVLMYVEDWGDGS